MPNPSIVQVSAAEDTSPGVRVPIPEMVSVSVVGSEIAGVRVPTPSIVVTRETVAGVNVLGVTCMSEATPPVFDDTYTVAGEALYTPDEVYTQQSTYIPSEAPNVVEGIVPLKDSTVLERPGDVEDVTVPMDVYEPPEYLKNLSVVEVI